MSVQNFKRTKIIATLGPSSSTEEIIEKLAIAGMNVARLNFSHGTYDTHEKNVALVRKVSEKVGKPIAIMQDIQGRKIRLGILREEPQMLSKGQKVNFVFEADQQKDEIPVRVNIFPQLHVGHIILINDGAIVLEAKKIHANSAECVIKVGGPIRSNKGVNLPTTDLAKDPITQKDKEDILFGLSQRVDYLAISFVQDARDIVYVRDFCKKAGYTPKIIAKIERTQAVENLDAITQVVDGILIGRGDLGVQVGQEDVPLIQRKAIVIAKKYEKPVIVATQMLESMIENPQPTRAEVNDVATAVLDKVDAVMLSAESAQGSYPVEAVTMMKNIILRVEEHIGEALPQQFLTIQSNNLRAIASSATFLAEQLSAKILFTFTTSGHTATQIAAFRPTMLIVAVTDDKTVYEQLALIWGVRAYLVKKISDNNKIYKELLSILKKQKIVESGDTAIVVGGTHPGISGHINEIQVLEVN